MTNTEIINVLEINQKNLEIYEIILERVTNAFPSEMKDIIEAVRKRSASLGKEFQGGGKFDE